MKMKFLTLLLLLSGYANSQNLVLNPGFEDGANIPNAGGQINYATNWQLSTCSGLAGATPDLFDSRSTNACYSVPSNKWASNLPSNTSPVTATTYRYAGLFGTNGTSDYLECIIGELSTPLAAGQYELTF